DGDVLTANVSGTGIAASYDAATETLTLSGTDTLAHYQSVLDAVTFDSTSGNPTNSGSNPTRTVTWTLDDGSPSNNLSAAATTTISFQHAIPYDFDVNGLSDLLFQDDAFNGGADSLTPQIWFWNGTAITAMATLPTPTAGFLIVG